MADDGMKVRIDGRDYELDEFEGRELVMAEREFGIALVPELERGSMLGVYAFLLIIKRRENPKITAAEVLEINLGEINRMVDDQQEEGDGQVPPPNRAQRRAAPKKKTSG